MATKAYQLPPLVRLTDATESGLWQTPVSDDAIERTVGKFNSRGEPKLSAEVKLWPTPDELNGQLNPEFVEWLMGFPLGWTVCEPSATPSSRKSRKPSDAQS
jgi:hypothetical protein